MESYFILANKEAGVSSGKIVAMFKKALGSKVGHAGTLDPAARGLMILATNEATKFIRFIPSENRLYRFKLTFGIKTNTGDFEGAIVEKSNVFPSEENILGVLSDFLGEIEQIPPVYSAIKIDGTRAYKAARKNIKLEMPSRKVRIYSLSLENYEEKESIFLVRCGSGTYVRSLGQDIATKLGGVGVVSEIERLEHGPFSNAECLGQQKKIELDILKNFYKNLHLCAEDIAALCVGKNIAIDQEDGVYAIVYNERFCGICEAKGGMLFSLRMVINRSWQF